MRKFQQLGPLTLDEHWSKERVLVIDDDPRSGSAVETALGATWEIVTVSAASYALEQLAAGERYDAILCVLESRHLTGQEFVRRAILIDRLLDRQIVFMSAEAEPTDATDVGARLCLRKPLHAEAIRAAVQARESRDDEKVEGVVMPSHFSPWGPFYADAPLLQRAINHAERLTELLKDTRPNDEDEDAASWLVGRVDEMQVFVELILQRWRYESLSETGAAAAITAYLDTLHHGLARYFCDLAPRCCEDALLTTLVPFGTQTAKMTAFRGDGRMTTADATVIDVDPAELFMTPAPSTPVSPL